MVNNYSPRPNIRAWRNSNQLKAAASWWVETPADEEQLCEPCRAILDNFRYIEQQRIKYGREIRPTFWGTADNVSSHRSLDRELVKDGLSYLPDEGFIYQMDEKVSFRDVFKVMKVDWGKVGQNEKLKE